ncbi:MAG: hypothetical protein EOO87_13890 [Pedobacter sp.]|nr:MAG: hypothetical protein EOO87_13890 [Pedobacter sp.]
MDITELIKHYKLSFFRRKDDLGDLIHVSNGGWFGWHLNELQDEEDIEQILVYVAHLLNGGAHDYDKDHMSTNITYATIYGNNVEVRGAIGDGSSAIEVITLLDFKVILEEWLRFLRT